MDVLVSRSALAKSLSLANTVANRRTTMPVLANVLLRAMGKKLLVAASDLTATISSEIDCEIKEGGSLTLNAKNLGDMVNSLDLDELNLKSADDSNAEILCGRSRFKLAGLPVKDFPKLPDHREVKFAEVPAAILRDMFERVAFSASTDDQRPTLYGVHFESDGENAMAVAADGQGLSYIKKPLAGLKVAGVLIPKKSVDDIVGLLAGAETAEVAVSKQHIFVRAGNTVLATQPTGQDWPLASLPVFLRAEHQHTMVAPRKALLAALDRAAIVSRGQKYAATLLTMEKDLLTVSAKDPKTGTSHDELAVSYDGAGKLSVLAASRLWIAYLKVLDGDEVQIGCGGPLDHMVIHAPGDRSAVTVLMPMDEVKNEKANAS